MTKASSGLEIAGGALTSPPFCRIFLLTARHCQLSVLCNLRMRPLIGDDIARRYARATSATGIGVKPVK